MKGSSFNEDKHFDSLVEKYGEVWWGNRTEAGLFRQHKRAKILAGVLFRYHNPRVLEIGCGTGIFSKYVLIETPHVKFVGCDISLKAIKIARERCRNYTDVNSIIMANAISLPFRNESFDAVVGNSILHHLPLEISLRELYRVLKCGGMIWFSEPNMMNPHVFIEKNIRIIGEMLQNTRGETAFFRWSLAKRLQSVGFRDIVIQPFDFLYPLTPTPLIKVVDKVGEVLERMVILKEIAGSLCISANKP